jgi:hypothetical protein
MFVEPMGLYPIIAGPAAQPDSMMKLVHDHEADVVWDEPERALLWVADYRCAMHLMMAVDGRLLDERPLVAVHMNRRHEAEEFMAEMYPGQPYRWAFNALFVFPSASAARRFEVEHRRSVLRQLDDPITARAIRCIESGEDDFAFRTPEIVDAGQFRESFDLVSQCRRSNVAVVPEVHRSSTPAARVADESRAEAPRARDPRSDDPAHNRPSGEAGKGRRFQEDRARH